MDQGPLTFKNDFLVKPMKKVHPKVGIKKIRDYLGTFLNLGGGVPVTPCRSNDCSRQQASFSFCALLKMKLISANRCSSEKHKELFRKGGHSRQIQR